MNKNRGWATEEAANDGLEERKAEIERLTEKSNAEQQAASKPAKASETPPAPLPAEEAGPTSGRPPGSG